MSERIEVTPLQMLQICTMEIQINQLSIASAQLKQHGCEEASEILRAAAQDLMAKGGALQQSWASRIVTPKLVLR